MPTDALRKETEECINNILKNNCVLNLDSRIKGNPNICRPTSLLDRSVK